MADEIAASHADVVVLQELTPVHLRQLVTHGCLDNYPWQAVNAQSGPTGMGLWARTPITEERWLNIDGFPQLRATLSVPGTAPWQLYGVHLPAPVRGQLVSWSDSFLALRDAVDQDRQHEAGPVLLAGDFNATLAHQPMHELLGTGLRDAAVSAHRQWQMTWPNGHRILPRLYRIDHVLVSERIRVVHYQLGRGVGSDHRPLLVELAPC
jgi:endonuclease/exonuclease/phosphatase (EEP) superfamily protein YafD